MKLPDDFLLHQVEVSTMNGEGAYGTTYGAPLVVRGFLDDTRALVRNSQGDQVVSESRFYCDLDQGSTFTDDSKVLVNGRRSYVIRVSRGDIGGMAGMPEYLEVALQ